MLAKPLPKDDKTPLVAGIQDASATTYGETVKHVESECLSRPTSKPIPQVHVYKRRWWMLGMFGSISLVQALVWNTWGPVSDSSSLVFGWSQATLTMLPNWGNIVFCLVVFFATWIMDGIGLRAATLGASGLMAIGTALRCVTSHPTTLLWLANVAAILNGAAGTVTFAGPALFSATWFPASQRATATAAVCMFNYMGIALSFIIGPLIVHYVNPYINHNSTLNLSTATVNYNPINDSVLYEIDRQRQEIMHLMYLECGLAGILFLLSLIYFPAKPPKPPSLSASVERVEFKKGLLKLLILPKFWIICLAYAIPVGTYGAWQAVWNFNLQPLGVSQTESGWIGFYTTVAFAAGGTVISRFSDIFARRMKAILIGFYLLASGALFWCALMIGQFISVNIVALYIAMILAGVFVNGGIPLFYELTCEVCYPVAEGVTGGFLTFINNFVGVIFFFILTIPHIGHEWMVWLLLGSTVAGLPTLLALKDTYSRLTIDSMQDNQKDAGGNTSNNLDTSHVQKPHIQGTQ